MKISKVLLASSLLLFTLTGCNSDKNAIIKVNDVPITKAQYERLYNLEIKSPLYQQFATALKDENNPISLMLKDRIVNELVIKEMINQEVEKRGIKVTKEEIEARKAEIIEKLGSKEKFDELLTQNGVTQKQFIEDVENEIKIDKLIQSAKKIEVTEKDAKDFYNSNKASFNYPERVRASHILIAVNPAEIKQEIVSQDKKGKLTSEDVNKKTQEIVDSKMKLAQEVRAKAAANIKDFAKLAKQYSDDKVSANQGGDLGFFHREAMVKPFSDVAFSLKPNTVSEIVVTDFGNHIIVVTDRAAAGVQPFEKMKDEIVSYLEQKNKIDTLKNLLDGLKASSKIEYVDENFDVNKIQEKIKEQNKNIENALKNKVPETK